MANADSKGVSLVCSSKRFASWDQTSNSKWVFLPTMFAFGRPLPV